VLSGHAAGIPVCLGLCMLCGMPTEAKATEAKATEAPATATTAAPAAATPTAAAQPADSGGVDLAALKADMAALVKRADAAEKRATTAEKRLADPTTLKAEISKLLGMDKVDDPAATVSALRGDVAKWQGLATRKAIHAEVMALVKDAHNPSRVAQLLDVSGIDLTPDGVLTGLDTLKERADELRKSDPYLFAPPPGTATAATPGKPPVTVPAPLPAAPAEDPQTAFIKAVQAGDMTGARAAQAKMNHRRSPFAVS
jgi:hypothetical protein